MRFFARDFPYTGVHISDPPRQFLSTLRGKYYFCSLITPIPLQSSHLVMFKGTGMPRTELDPRKSGYLCPDKGRYFSYEMFRVFTQKFPTALNYGMNFLVCQFHSHVHRRQYKSQVFYFLRGHNHRLFCVNLETRAMNNWTAVKVFLKDDS